MCGELLPLSIIPIGHVPNCAADLYYTACSSLLSASSHRCIYVEFSILTKETFAICFSAQSCAALIPLALVGMIMKEESVRVCTAFPMLNNALSKVPFISNLAVSMFLTETPPTLHCTAICIALGDHARMSSAKILRFCTPHPLLVTYRTCFLSTISPINCRCLV